MTTEIKIEEKYICEINGKKVVQLKHYPVLNRWNEDCTIAYKNRLIKKNKLGKEIMFFSSKTYVIL